MNLTTDKGFVMTFKKLNSLVAPYLFILLALLSTPFLSAFAWNNSIEFGYGRSHDPNHTKYYNSGYLLSGDFYPIYRSSWTFWSVNASLGHWYTTTPQNKNLTTGAVSLALRVYPFNISSYPAYLLGSLGPALMSNRKFGNNTQGSNFTLQTNLGLGIEFCSFDLNLRLEHFSNANLAKPNQGFNILYLLSIGYLF